MNTLKLRGKLVQYEVGRVGDSRFGGLIREISPIAQTLAWIHAGTRTTARKAMQRALVALS